MKRVKVKTVTSAVARSQCSWEFLRHQNEARDAAGGQVGCWKPGIQKVIVFVTIANLIKFCIFWCILCS